MQQSPPKVCESRANIMKACASSTILYNVGCCMFLGNFHLSLHISVIKYRETKYERGEGKYWYSACKVYLVKLYLSSSTVGVDELQFSPSNFHINVATFYHNTKRTSG